MRVAEWAALLRRRRRQAISRFTAPSQTEQHSYNMVGKTNVQRSGTQQVIALQPPCLSPPHHQPQQLNQHHRHAKEWAKLEKNNRSLVDNK
jgi:hypothetical protein